MYIGKRGAVVDDDAGAVGFEQGAVVRGGGCDNVRVSYLLQDLDGVLTNFNSISASKLDRSHGMVMTYQTSLRPISEWACHTRQAAPSLANRTAA